MVVSEVGLHSNSAYRLIPTIEFLRDRFCRFNVQMFGGRLPLPLITLCSVSSFVGQYKSKLKRLADGRSEASEHLLRFSTAFDLSEQELEDTVIHEMIHYFIAYNGLRDRTAHGPLFKAMMSSINEHHGRNISISHRTTHEAIASAKSATKKWHVVAILYFSSGETGVKVLPRVIPKIVEYYKGITAAPNIRRVDLFLHNDPFFNRFPTSTGRRCHAISQSEISEHLRGAHILEVKKDKIIQR